MAYLFVSFPMTLDDLEGHSRDAGLLKCNSINISVTFSTCSPSVIAELRFAFVDVIVDSCVHCFFTYFPIYCMSLTQPLPTVGLTTFVGPLALVVVKPCVMLCMYCFTFMITAYPGCPGKEAVKLV